MLKDLFEAVVSVSQKAIAPEKPAFVDQLASVDGREVAYVYDGRVHRVKLDAPPRRHSASSAADFCKLVNQYATAESGATVFVADDEVVAVLDNDRRNRVSMMLPRSDHFEILASLPRNMNQRDAIAFLRRQLHGTGFENYANNLRQVVFERQQAASGNSQRDRESMGKSIESRVSGTQDLPEFLKGEISVFDRSVFRSTHPVLLGVDVRLSEESFDFWIPPDDLADAERSARTQLVEYLEDQIECLIVCGSET